MKNKTTQSKTNQADLARYSFYSSGQHSSTKRAQSKQPKKPKRRNPFSSLLILIVVVAIGFFIYSYLQPTKVSSGETSSTIKPVAAKKVVPIAATNYCDGNTLSRMVKVSISLRHMWACDGDTTEYNSPVVTGIEYLAADRTPLGTYQIYAKLTDQILTGSDTTGSWRDPVSYWMPFLDNQYGAYGFHDATWRASTAFGNINPDSSEASHGCVELPLATAAWLYNWAAVGTTVSIVA
jgi:L,D-transpeptidase catalytic domain